MLNIPSAPSQVTDIYKDEARTAELERMIGQLTMENALLKKALSRLEMQVGSARRNGGRS
jgi:hypothetical protein